MGFFDSIKSAFNTGFQTVARVTSKITGTIKHAGSTALKGVGKGISTVYNDAKSGVVGIVNTGKEIIEHGQDSFSGLFSSLGNSFAWPIAAAAVGVGGIYLLTR